jgi:hypothetical protein
MKVKLFFVALVLALTAVSQPSSAAAPTCSSYCAIVRCIDGYICGSYVNSSGQTVCGCHPRF